MTVDGLCALPFEQPDLLSVPALLRTLQADRPISRVRTPAGDEAWLVTRHAEVRQLLGDDRLGISHPDPGNAPRINDSVFYGSPLGNFDTEHADLARMRRLLQPYFAPKRMRALRPRVEALTDQLLDDLALRSAPVDMHKALSLSLPVLVICELLGVPYDDRAQFRSWSDEIADTRDRQRSEAALGKLFDYMKQLVTRKRARPGDDVLSGLRGTDGVDDDEAAMMGASLLFAGHETTVVRIDIGTLLLLANPGQWQALRDDPALAAAAVEEILRTSATGGGGVPRWARTDIHIDDDAGGVTIRAGDAVLLDIGAANHDDRVFADPDRFDITRTHGAHLMFGHGPRYCLGAPLARIELQAVFARLTVRFPAMRLAVPLDQIPARTHVLTGGVTELPVTW
jgi:cytochrome P450